MAHQIINLPEVPANAPIDIELMNLGDATRHARICADLDPQMQRLTKFLEQYRATSSTKHKSNVSNRLVKDGSYIVPPESMDIFFAYLDICRLNHIKMSISEKQQEHHSGIMIDFDLEQDVSDSQLTDKIIRKLVHAIYAVIIKYVELHADLDVTYAVVIRKPACKPLPDHPGSFKDGIHILFPGVQIDRTLKRMIVTHLRESDALTHALHKITLAKHLGDKTPSSCVDENSKHVPVFFLGCSSKPNAIPYIFHSAYTVENEASGIDVNEDRDLYMSPNLAHECSVNWECKIPGSRIIKRQCNVAMVYFNAHTAMNARTQYSANDAHANRQQISTLAMRAPEIESHRRLLDLLAPRRSVDYVPWKNVIVALAGISPAYYSLAIYFSRKAPLKFDQAGVDKHWKGANESKKSGLGLQAIRDWAKEDSPEEYEIHRKNEAATLIDDRIHCSVVQGDLQDGDIADILFKLLSHKYVSAMHPSGKRVWYEFMTKEDDHKELELYKWAMTSQVGLAPESLNTYVRVTLRRYFTCVLNKIRLQFDEASSDVVKHYKKVHNSLRLVTKHLHKSHFIRSILSACETRFAQRGFYESLDRDPMIRGVKNGVLQLCPSGLIGPSLIESAHSHRVSKSTTASYTKFDINDSEIKRVVIALRNMFPDEESDSFEFVMHWLASTLDSRAKDSMFVIMIGGGSNGKSVLMAFHNAVLGSTYCAPMPISFITGKSGHAESASPATMLLKNASLCFYSESERFEMLNMAKIKQFTGKEPITGRNLHEGCETFQPNAHHLMMSNNEPLINSSDWGTWRRIVMIRAKIKFMPNPDPTNPLERRSDPKVADVWPQDESIKAKYYGFMAFMHFILNREYGGDVRAVPHPHIKYDTDEFRKAQDPISKFLTQHLVCYTEEYKSRPEVRCQPPLMSDLEVEIKKYITWYDAQYNRQPMAHGLIGAFQNSSIHKLIVRDGCRWTLVGHTFLTPGDRFDSTTYQYALSGDVKESFANNFGVPVESAEEWWDRVIVTKYNLYKDVLDAGVVIDGYHDEDAKLEEETAPEFFADLTLSDEPLRKLDYAPNHPIYPVERSLVTYSRKPKPLIAQPAGPIPIGKMPYDNMPAAYVDQSESGDRPIDLRVLASTGGNIQLDASVFDAIDGMGF